MNRLSLKQIDFLIAQNQTMLDFESRGVIQVPPAERFMAQSCLEVLKRQRTQILKYQEEQKRRLANRQDTH